MQDIIKSIEKSLIGDTVKLFAVVALADGVISDEEKEFIKIYFQSLYPGNLVEALEHLFYKDIENIKVQINKIKTKVPDIEKLLTVSKDITKGLATKLSEIEKLILVMKVIELIAADEVLDIELSVLNQIASDFDIKNEDVSSLLSLISIKSSSELVINKQSLVKTLRFSENEQKSEVCFKHKDLDFIIFSIGKEFFILQKDLINNIKINNSTINNNFFYKLPHECEIVVNNKYIIKHYDIKYYFKNLLIKDYIFYLNHENNRNFISDKQSALTILKIKLVSAKVYIEKIKNETELLVNDEVIEKGCQINLDDEVFHDTHKVNIRTILNDVFFQEKEVKITGKNKFILGNRQIDDIFLEDDYEISWHCVIEKIDKNFIIKIQDCPFPVFVNNFKIKETAVLKNNDKVSVLKHVITCNLDKNLFEINNVSLGTLNAENISYSFKDGTKGVDNLNFNATKGELVGLMGASGCGKTTLLNLIIGHLKPQLGEIKIDDYNIQSNKNLFQSLISYVPQDDLLFENLSIYENLYYNAKLRYPDGSRNIEVLVNNVLKDIGLFEKKHLKVGDSLNKVISGGERKRLNIGLELLSESDLILLDEPTSGLSSKDSEKLLLLIQNIALKGKMVLIVIHQPSNKLFKLFDKLILLDKGGKLAFFGEALNSFLYFRNYTTDYKNEKFNSAEINPDYLLDVIEQPLLDIDGTPLPLRKYSPDFWQTEFKKNQAVENIKSDEKKLLPFQAKRSILERFNIFKALLIRNFKNKLRDKLNIIITFILPPILALSVGGILHYAPGEKYSFFENNQVGTFLFLSVLISVFLGITNSIEEIIKDQKILLREKMLKISNLNYYLSKYLTLVPFAIIQNVLFIGIGYFILGGKEFYLHFILVTSLVAMIGIAIGLFVSSIPKVTSKAATNLIPIILIPQIIFGGALITFEQMNKQLKLYENSPMPEVCNFMPTRYGFEAMVTYIGANNKYDKGQSTMLIERDSLTQNVQRINLKAQEMQLSNDSINLLNSLLQKRDSVNNILQEYEEKYKNDYGNSQIHASTYLDGNQDYKNFIAGKTSVYPMFMKTKKVPILNTEVSTFSYNVLLLCLIHFVISIATLIILKLRFKN